MNKAIYRREVGKAQLVMEVPPDYPGGYQFSMLAYNEPEGYLPVSECSEGMTRRYYYDVTGCNCLEDMMIRGSMDREMVRSLIQSLCRALEQSDEYLLDGGRISLDPSFIYYRQGQFSFCYIPFKEPDFDWEFQKLAAFVVDHTDKEDAQAVGMAEALEELSQTFQVDLKALAEIAEGKHLSEAPNEEAEREAVLIPEEMVEPLEEEPDEADLPWDQWQLEKKPGLFRWP